MSQQKTPIDQYRDHLARIGKSAHTLKAYNRDVGALALWWEQSTGQEFNPQVVDPRDIQEYRGYLVRQEWAPATINRRLIALRRFFHWAKRERLVVGKPFEVLESVLVKRQKDTAPRWLNREELTRLNQVEGSIKGRARQLTGGDPMSAEDLAQQGREAAIRLQLPGSHLVVKAKDAISQYRKRGSSVDGKLDTRSRNKHYHILSLEELVFLPCVAAGPGLRQRAREPGRTSGSESWGTASLSLPMRLPL